MCKKQERISEYNNTTKTYPNLHFISFDTLYYSKQLSYRSGVIDRVINYNKRWVQAAFAICLISHDRCYLIPVLITFKLLFILIYWKKVHFNLSTSLNLNEFVNSNYDEFFSFSRLFHEICKNSFVRITVASCFD